MTSGAPDGFSPIEVGGRFIALAGPLFSRPHEGGLELGFRGTDARGHNVNQGPRPYLRPSVTENEAAIKQILCSGTAPNGSQHGTKRMSDVSGVTHGE